MSVSIVSHINVVVKVTELGIVITGNVSRELRLVGKMLHKNVVCVDSSIYMAVYGYGRFVTLLMSCSHPWPSLILPVITYFIDIILYHHIIM